MNNGKIDWKGCVVAAVTPFKANGDIDEEKFVANLELLIGEGVHGFVISGCTGESWSLDAEERLRLFKTAVKVAKKRVPIIAGTGGIVTKKVIELSIAAKEAGCEGVMVLPPYYAIPGTREVLAHFKAISDQAKTPILVYNIPRRTGVNITPEILDQLCANEWVCAVKQSSNDFIELERTIAAVGDKIVVLAGHSAERGVPAILMGAKGWVSSMESQVMGREAISMFGLVKAGKLDEARRIQMRALKLDSNLRHGIGTFPANTKAAMNLRGRPGGHVRQPLLDLTPQEVEKCAALLRDCGLLDGARAAAE
jgi:4-hydroxy-tetrahydrodipicolinate synthase